MNKIKKGFVSMFILRQAFFLMLILSIEIE
ncbi:hypothetical protein J2W97_000717 [Paenibacillus jamilae]|nr:hypothetical protein [Paenibacillus jamilae]